MTTFITPFGHLKYLRAPYGISSISKCYNRRMDEASAGCDDFRKIVDDVVIFDSDPQKYVQHVRQILHCYEEKLSLDHSFVNQKHTHANPPRIIN